MNKGCKLTKKVSDIFLPDCSLIINLHKSKWVVPVYSLLPRDCTLNPQDIVEKSCKTIQMNALQLWYVHLNWCCTTIPI